MTSINIGDSGNVSDDDIKNIHKVCDPAKILELGIQDEKLLKLVSSFKNLRSLTVSGEIKNLDLSLF